MHLNWRVAQVIVHLLLRFRSMALRWLLVQLCLHFEIDFWKPSERDVTCTVAILLHRRDFIHIIESVCSQACHTRRLLTLTIRHKVSIDLTTVFYHDLLGLVYHVPGGSDSLVYVVCAAWLRLDLLGICFLVSTLSDIVYLLSFDPSRQSLEITNNALHRFHWGLVLVGFRVFAFFWIDAYEAERTRPHNFWLVNACGRSFAIFLDHGLTQGLDPCLGWPLPFLDFYIHSL